MGKKILSGDQIDEGVRVKLIKNFSNIPVESKATITGFELDEDLTINSIVLHWDIFGNFPYITYDIPEEMNIINFLEIID